MNAIEEMIVDAIETELTAANEKHPMFSSLHEGYAVILEEVEEAAEELQKVKDQLANTWACIRTDKIGGALTNLTQIKYAAAQLAIEACQVAAMAEKAIQSEAKTAERADKLMELHDKHWEECRQIALYDNELKMTATARDLARMCETSNCDGCPFEVYDNCLKVILANPISSNADILKWCAEHPENTNCSHTLRKVKTPKEKAGLSYPEFVKKTLAEMRKKAGETE